MSEMFGTNQTQAEYWRSPSGAKWIDHEHALDAAMTGMLDAAEIMDGDRVVDIGCGTGASTLAAAARAGDGTVMGVDIAEPLLARARARADVAGIANVAFTLADAQTHDFPAGGFDRLVSRLGMMFFADPVAALRNLARALKPGGRMAFVAWAGVAHNPWFQVPKDAAVARLGPAPAADPHAPGPLGFQDADRVVGLMRDAGLVEVQGGPVTITLTPPDGLAGAARTASRVGPAARIMKAHAGTEADAAAIEAAVADGFRGHAADGTARIPGVVNLFTATCPAAG